MVSGGFEFDNTYARELRGFYVPSKAAEAPHPHQLGLRHVVGAGLEHEPHLPAAGALVLALRKDERSPLGALGYVAASMALPTGSAPMSMETSGPVLVGLVKGTMACTFSRPMAHGLARSCYPKSAAMCALAAQSGIACS